jgi:poly(3-hydroxybutyrate) depolymerase
MLYQLQEFQRALLEPLSSWAQTTAKALTNPTNPLSIFPGTQRVAAGYELLHRIGKAYEKPEFGIKSVEAHGKKVAITEFTVIEKPFARLTRFKRFSDDVEVIQKMKNDPVVLIVTPLSGHHATLLRDTVNTLLQNHKVYITDWTDARLVPMEHGIFHLDDYVHYVQDFIRAIGAQDLNVISVCQPTVPVLAAISLMATNGETTPRTMTMMGGPIDTRKSPTSVNSLATTKSFEWFENNVIYTVPPPHPGAGRRVYPGFLQYTGFVAMNPDRHMQSHWDYFLDLVKGDKQDIQAHIEFYDEYNAVLDMDAAYYLETIKTVFQDFALPLGTWKVGGQLVRPQDIKTTALLTVEGELDDISGSGQTRAAHGLCKSIPENRKLHYELQGAGHYGIFSGRRWREFVFPTISEFIRKNAVKTSPATKTVAKKTSVKKTTQKKSVARPSAAKKTVRRK